MHVYTLTCSFMRICSCAHMGTHTDIKGKRKKTISLVQIHVLSDASNLSVVYCSYKNIPGHLDNLIF